MADSTTFRIQKILANLGYGSRRKIEQLITSGEVLVNGKKAILGDKATIGDLITIDRKAIKITANLFRTKTRVLLYNKQIGEVTTVSDEHGRSTVFENLPPIENGKWINIGRLDINTSGLLLFTNDGNFANKMMHPSSNIEREYLVKLTTTINQHTLAKLKKGVILDDGFAKFKLIEQKEIVDSSLERDNKWYRVIITEGRNREVRRIFESQNLMVNKLMRIRFGDFTLPQDLPKGRYIEIKV